MNEIESFRSPIGPLIGRYLALKRGLGRRYAREGRILRSLDALLASAPPTASDLTPETFALWCQTLLHLTPTVRRKGRKERSSPLRPQSTFNELNV